MEEEADETDETLENPLIEDVPALPQQHQSWQWQSYFDIDSEDFWNRCVCSVTSFHRREAFRHSDGSIQGDGQADLYGPLWITVTLAFLTALSLASHDGVGAMEDFSWALAILGSFVLVAPIIVYYVPSCFATTTRTTTMSRIDWICLYGYSLVPYFPFIILRSIFLAFFHDAPAVLVIGFLAIPTLLSGLFIAQNAPLTEKNASFYYCLLASHGTLFLWLLNLFGGHNHVFYVLSMSYQPEFCSGGHCVYPVPEGLTIHGLWPEWYNGTWPSSCSDEPLTKSAIRRVGYNRLQRLWPNSRAKPGDSAYAGLWEHEWSKHGTCSGLSQEAYLEETLDHFLDTPRAVRKNFGKNMQKNDFILAYGGAEMVAAICSLDYYYYLSEVRVCYGADAAGHPTYRRIKCPQFVLDQDSCRSDTIALRGH